jgi:hypothetical protein
MLTWLILFLILIHFMPETLGQASDLDSLGVT